MLNASEAFSLTVENLKTQIPPEVLKEAAEKIRHSVNQGGGECVLIKEKLVVNKKPISVKMMRYLETLLVAKGYRVQMGYGCMNMTVRWI